MIQGQPVALRECILQVLSETCRCPAPFTLGNVTVLPPVRALPWFTCFQYLCTYVVGPANHIRFLLSLNTKSELLNFLFDYFWGVILIVLM